MGRRHDGDGGVDPRDHVLDQVAKERLARHRLQLGTQHHQIGFALGGQSSDLGGARATRTGGDVRSNADAAGQLAGLGQETGG